MKAGVSICLAFIFLLVTVLSEPMVGLYSTKDNVTILTGKTFNQTVFNSPYIWLVEFYSSTCGHCMDFAPMFRDLAKDVQDWQRVIHIGVINCPDERNQDICRHMNVMGYPTLRIFSPFSNATKGKDVQVKRRTVPAYRSMLVREIENKLDLVGWDFDGKEKPNFQFVKYKWITDFFNVPGPYYLAVVAEAPSSEVGKEIILDMSSCSNITVRRFDSSSSEMNDLIIKSGMKIEDFPSVIMFTRDGRVDLVEVKMRTRSFFTYKLQRLPGVGEPKRLPQQESTDDGPVMVLNSIDWSEVDRSIIYVADIESALQYILTMEVPVRIVKVEALNPLKTFIGTIASLSPHLPILPSSRNFLLDLKSWLDEKDKVDFQMWEEKIRERKPNSFLPDTNKKWVGCSPSEPGLRGYPCSLWTLFHAMTVAAYNAKDKDVTAVPRAIEAYISSFFGCQDCSENFAREVVMFPYKEIDTNEESVLWLWRLHNSVNERLRNAPSEDPEFPKIQFPSPKECPGCRNPKGFWNENEIVKFLVGRFSLEHASMKYLKMEKEENLQQNPPENLPVLDNILIESDPLIDIPARMETIDSDFDAGEDSVFKKPILEFPKKNGVNGHPVLLEEMRNDRKKEPNFEMDDAAGRLMVRDLSNLDGDWHNGFRVQLGFTELDTSLCVLLWGSSFIAVSFLYCYVQKKKMTKYCKI